MLGEGDVKTWGTYGLVYGEVDDWGDMIIIKQLRDRGERRQNPPMTSLIIEANIRIIMNFLSKLGY